MSGITQCMDFMMFQRALTQLRGIDDKILAALNPPTQSMQARGESPKDNCLQLQQELATNYKTREESIRRCIQVVGDEVKQYKSKVDSGDILAMAEMRGKTTTVRMLSAELDVEEIIRNRSDTVFRTKCGVHLES